MKLLISLEEMLLGIVLAKLLGQLVPEQLEGRRSDVSGGNCVAHYHDRHYYRLAAANYHLRCLPKKDWVKPTGTAINDAKIINDYELGTVCSLTLT